MWVGGGGSRRMGGTKGSVGGGSRREVWVVGGGSRREVWVGGGSRRDVGEWGLGWQKGSVGGRVGAEGKCVGG